MDIQDNVQQWKDSIITKNCGGYAYFTFNLFKQHVLKNHTNGKFKVDTIVDYIKNHIGVDIVLDNKLIYNLIFDNVGLVAFHYAKMIDLTDDSIDFEINFTQSCVSIYNKEKKTKKRLQQWKDKLSQLEQQRERNVNRYILPIEIKMEELREKIEEKELENKK